MTQVTAQDFWESFMDVFDGQIYGSFVKQNAIEKFDALLSQVRAQAHAEGRREGLREMNTAWMMRHADEMQSVEKLRQEYSNQP